jgi:hypothetical protein
MGLDPRAWKGLQGIDDPLRLPAGLQVDFSTALSPAGGLGVEFGAAPPPPGRDRPTAALPAGAPADGPALAAAGGLTALLERTAAANAGAAAGATRDGFVPGTDAARPAAPVRFAGATAGRPTVDRRSLGFGFGVPLRPRAAAGPARTPGLVTTGPPTSVAAGPAPTRRTAGGDLPPETDDPTVPGWRALGTGPREPFRRRSASCGCAS